ncbi:DUF1715 domain-containing [Pyrenophora seminiperda CCB06]|uniref:DUF1715 domain-containing n=1 Tax=Pyrenophora seminiperda CCB06 TaxID=1302712 RepID=A0A3M7LVF5_9PLEO|nr:DUF1715 domain-containing [Pyrenophora seminiperda CCB06]
MSSQPDPFDTLLTLEDTLYTTAYTLGATDGAHAGRIEGRVFGLEKGFEKFAALGSLHGRSVIWASRLPALSHPPNLEQHHDSSRSGSGSGSDAAENKSQLPMFPRNERLRNNTTLLHSLTDPETFDTANTEDAVADFDDRFKRAGAKAKVIERIVGETENAISSSRSPDGSPARGKGPVRVAGDARRTGTAKKGDDSIEDFAGSKLLR